jgi:hypothetical protein
MQMDYNTNTDELPLHILVHWFGFQSQVASNVPTEVLREVLLVWIPQSQVASNVRPYTSGVW